MNESIYGDRDAMAGRPGFFGRFATRCARLNVPVMLMAVAVATIGGCASSEEQPDREIAGAEASIAQAERSGGRQYGTAELDAARDKLAKARAAVQRDDMVAARYYAEEAAVDAELASAMSRNRKAEQSAQELNKSIEALQQEISRNQNSRGELQ